MAAPCVFSQLGGLFEKWDADPKLRLRMREIGQVTAAIPEEGQKEASGTLTKTMQNLKYNAGAVLPLIECMHGVYDKVPCIEALEEQINKFADQIGVRPKKVTLNEQAWSLRYMFGLLKQNLYKQSAPRVFCQQMFAFDGGSGIQTRLP